MLDPGDGIVDNEVNEPPAQKVNSGSHRRR